MLSSAYHTRALLSLCERGNGGVYLQHTIAPGTANGGVCVRTPVPLSLRTLGFGFSPTYVLTFIECMLIQSIRCQKNRPCVCVCVCVCGSMSLSLSFSLKWRCVCTLTLALAHPLLSHSLFPFFPYTPLSLSLCRTTTCLLPYFYLFLSSYFHLRPQNRESTVSRPICEVKHGID